MRSHGTKNWLGCVVTMQLQQGFANLELPRIRLACNKLSCCTKTKPGRRASYQSYQRANGDAQHKRTTSAIGRLLSAQAQHTGHCYVQSFFPEDIHRTNYNDRTGSAVSKPCKNPTLNAPGVPPPLGRGATFAASAL